METMEIRTIVTTAWRPARCSILVPLLSIYKQLYFTGDDLGVNFISGPRRAVNAIRLLQCFNCAREVGSGTPRLSSSSRMEDAAMEANAPDEGSSYILL